MKNKLSFFTSMNKSFWELPEDMVPEIFKYLSSEELLEVPKMQPFKSPDKEKVESLDEAKIEELSRQALIELCSRYSSKGDLLNQRRGLLLCPSGIFVNQNPQYLSKVSIFTKALYRSMQHVEDRYPYKIQALFYLAAANGNPINIHFQSDVEALLKRMENTRHNDYSVEVELLLPFFTEDQINRLGKICFNQTHELSFHVKFGEKNEQEVLVSSTSFALSLFTKDDIATLWALLKSPDHNHIKKILTSAHDALRASFNLDEINEIRNILDASNEIELGAKVLSYKQSNLERHYGPYLNVFNTYLLEDENFHVGIEMLEGIDGYLDIKAVSNGLEKFALKSSKETRQAALKLIFEQLQKMRRDYDIPFMYFYLIRQFGRDNPELITGLYDFAILKITAIPPDEGDMQYGLSILENIAVLLKPEQAQECFDLVWTMFSPSTTNSQSISRLASSWLASFTTFLASAPLKEKI